MMEEKNAFEKGAGFAWACWVGVTGCFFALTSLALAAGGVGMLERCIQTDSLSISAQTLACAGLVWLVSGVTVRLLRESALRSRYGWHIVFAFVLLVLYLNFLRERPQYADIQDYVRAAFDLKAGVPFHIRYLYPPFLATLCQPFLGLGYDGLAALFWCANWIGLVLYFILLVKTLETYGVETRCACTGVFLFMLVNVPVLRTLSFIQVNFHVMNLILMAVLFYPRQRFFSALLLAIAVHLKASPLVIALPFVCLCDKRWLLSFVFCGCAIFAATYLWFGWGPYGSFLTNVKMIYQANGISFRENSIDALVRTVAIAVRTDGTALVPYIKFPVLAGLLGCVVYSVRSRMWLKQDGRSGWILNSLPLLLVLMVFASPLVWEHHFVFLAVPFLLVLRKVETAAEWAAYGAAYLSVFWMPTFDFYPWSFCRFFGAGTLLVLCLRLAAKADSPWFEAFSQELRMRLQA